MLPGIKTFIYCSKPTNGRYVFLKLKENDHLTLCEVEVYALKPGEKGMAKCFHCFLQVRPNHKFRYDDVGF